MGYYSSELADLKNIQVHEKYYPDVTKTIETNWGNSLGNSQSDVLLQVTYRPSDSHNNLPKGQLGDKENYQTLNAKTEKHATSLTMRGG